jgi:hypothetical protein
MRHFFTKCVAWFIVFGIVLGLESSSYAKSSSTRRQSLGMIGGSFISPLVTSAVDRNVVLVAGASGRTGVEVMRALTDDKRYTPFAQIRATSILSANSLTAAVVCDVTASDAAAVLEAAIRREGVHDVICTLGFVPAFAGGKDAEMANAVDNRGIVALIRAAEAARLPGRFVLVSSLLTS